MNIRGRLDTVWRIVVHRDASRMENPVSIEIASLQGIVGAHPCMLIGKQPRQRDRMLQDYDAQPDHKKNLQPKRR